VGLLAYSAELHPVGEHNTNPWMEAGDPMVRRIGSGAVRGSLGWSRRVSRGTRRRPGDLFRPNPTADLAGAL